MKIDEALYQLKQNIKMHEIEGTTSNQNEREKALLDYITNLQEEIERQSKAQVILDNQIAEMLKYKSRNEKATEYCENNKEYTPRLIDIIDILKGDE